MALKFKLDLGQFCLWPSSWAFDSLRPSDAIWQQWSGSTLAQVIACCLMAPSHYLNQCWLVISKVEWHSSEGEFTRDTSAINHWNYLKKNKDLKFHSYFPGANELKSNTWFAVSQKNMVWLLRNETYQLNTRPESDQAVLTLAMTFTSLGHVFNQLYISMGRLIATPLLTHWGWVAHLWIRKLTIIRPQAIIWTGA